MKTKKFLMLLAAVLLSCASAMAQNSPLKGDVNGDGKVDVADIVAILDIMKNGGEMSEQTTYYWYVGTTQPTDPHNLEQNTGLNVWTEIGKTLPETDIKVFKEDLEYYDHTWYIAAPSAAGFVLYNGTNAASNETTYDKSTFYVGNIEYTLWKSKSLSDQTVGYLHYDGNVKYYWYIGPQKPTESTNPILRLARYETDLQWHKIRNELNTYNSQNKLFDGASYQSPLSFNWEGKFYIALPVGIRIHDDKDNDITSQYELESQDITIAGERYNVYSGPCNYETVFINSLY